jgi:hypothetical protein
MEEMAPKEKGTHHRTKNIRLYQGIQINLKDKSNE